MWNSGQQPPAWGWPPNLNYQYSHQQVDPSQGWAAAAALWAQQRQLQEQYQNGGVSSPSNVKPPEPPGPPPAMPPLPPMPSSNSVEVHDYMHGKTAVPPTEVVDYQHGRVAEPVHGDVIDYNHGKPESVPEQNWAHDNDTWQQPSHPPPGNYYNNEQWGNEYANYYDSAPPETEQRLYQQSDENVSNNVQPKHGLSTDFHKSTGHYNKADSKHIHVLQNISGNSSPDAAALAKKTKTLPLWLRQGLEKLEKDKNKPTSEKTDNLSSKSDSLPTSPAKEKMNDSEVERDQNSVADSDDNEEEQEDTRRHKHDRHRVKRSPSVEHNEYSKAFSEDESEEEDEVEKQKKLMLKIKTWMTEILLGVTNAAVKEICHDVYFEIKKSVKVKAKQLRRSGGLDALRMASLGDEDSASSEDDQENEEEEEKRKSLKEKRKQTFSAGDDIRTQNAGDLFTEKRTDKSDRLSEIQEGKRRLKREEQPKSYEVNDLRPHEQREQKVEKNNSRTRSRRRSSHEEAGNSGNDSSSESVSRSESSDSERERRRKKSKRRRSRSESQSPPKKSRKKSKRRGRESSSSDSERRKRKKKRKNRGSSSDYDSDNSSSTTKKRSRGKKHKHKARSSSRSPRRYKRKR